MDEEHAFYLRAGTDNPEQVEAHLNAKIAPFLDLLFNRTTVKMPTIPAEFSRDLEQLDADIKRGEIGKHFCIDRKTKKITPQTDAANNLVIFMHMVKDEPAITQHIQREGGAICEQ